MMWRFAFVYLILVTIGAAQAKQGVSHHILGR
jgi:hypothetical protein